MKHLKNFIMLEYSNSILRSVDIISSKPLAFCSKLLVKWLLMQCNKQLQTKWQYRDWEVARCLAASSRLAVRYLTATRPSAIRYFWTASMTQYGCSDRESKSSMIFLPPSFMFMPMRSKFWRQPQIQRKALTRLIVKRWAKGWRKLTMWVWMTLKWALNYSSWPIPLLETQRSSTLSATESETIYVWRGKNVFYLCNLAFDMFIKLASLFLKIFTFSS